MPKGRLIILIDMDCFYVQVEQRDDPSLYGKPTAVVQYNQWKKGGIIALSYEARARGVKRSMRGSDAECVCPDLRLVPVPTKRGKADLSKYRAASGEVFDVLTGFDGVAVERASIDEAFLDVTEAVDVAEAQAIDDHVSTDDLSHTRVAVDDDPKRLTDYLADVQNDPDEHRLTKRLLLAVRLAELMRRRILERTKFRCSAGIATNKMLAKLVCKINKPNGQTVIFPNLVHRLFEKTPIYDIRNLGGKLGKSVASLLNVDTVAQLAAVPLEMLQLHFGQKTANWLKEVSHGVDNDPVTPRQIVKSIGSAKNFTGKAALCTKAEVRFWIEQLAEGLLERLTEDQNDNRRIAKTLTVGFRNQGDINCTRQAPLISYDAEAVVHTSLSLISDLCREPADSNLWSPPVTMLSISASRFEDYLQVDSKPITTYFSAVQKPVIGVESPLDFEKKILARIDESQTASDLSREEKATDGGLRSAESVETIEEEKTRGETGKRQDEKGKFNERAREETGRATDRRGRWGGRESRQKNDEAREGTQKGIRRMPKEGESKAKDRVETLGQQNQRGFPEDKRRGKRRESPKTVTKSQVDQQLYLDITGLEDSAVLSQEKKPSSLPSYEFSPGPLESSSVSPDLFSPRLSTVINGNDPSCSAGPVCTSTPKRVAAEPEAARLRADLMPEVAEDIDREAWVHLPPDVQWEVRQMMKRRTAAVAIPDVADQLPPAGDLPVASKRKKKKKVLPQTSRPVVKSLTLENFFMRLK